MTQDRLNQRILDIDFTTSNAGNDIFDVDAVTFYRNAQSRTAGNGFSVAATASDGEGGTKRDMNFGGDHASNEVWIFLSQQIPRVGVIILDQATTT